MEHFTLAEAAKELDLKADFLLKTILFSGKAHPILKPCVFISEPTSMRLTHRNANIYVTQTGIEHTIISLNDFPNNPAEAARMKRVNRHWSEDAQTPCSYPQVICQGLFELTFYPENMDMTEVKESGRIQLYREMAVCASLADIAVDRIMNNWHAMRDTEISRAKDQMRGQQIRELVILTQNDLHYIVDVPTSISLSDIRITDRMLTEYAASEGITRRKNRTKIIPPDFQTVKQPTREFCIKDVLPIRFIEYYTGGKLGPESIALLFAHKQGIDWNRRMKEADKLTAYHWQYGKITPLKRTEWESILYSIQSLSERYDNIDKHFNEWLTAALKILPVAFVWRSEFDAAYRRAMSPERITFLDQSKGFERLTGDEDKEAREINVTPYIPPELMDMVFEGFEQEGMAISQGVPEPNQVSKRHIITAEERKVKSRSAIRLSVEAYLDTAPDGNKAGFYTFLKKKIKLPKEVILKDGESYTFFFKDVKEKGSQEGVYLNHPKEGKKEGDAGWNHYSGNDISGIISKEKKNRKNSQHEK